ncbi:MAG: hypothetical protein Q9211_001246 [Gyalolechia sp. 1 TL-2023]
MDPLAGISLAGAILQFVDFGLRVVAKGMQIYRSVDGTLTENVDLEAVTNDLLVIQAKLQCSRPPTGAPSMPSKDAQAFESLRATAAKTAEKLVERLNMVKAQGRFRAWKSLRQALKSVWSKRDIEEMASRLQWFRSELQLRLLISLRDRQIFTGTIAQVEDSVKRASNSRHLVHGRKELLQYAIPALIQSLRFPGLMDRYENVAEAHGQTFSWIFTPDDGKQPWHSFTSWLEESTSIYWIMGKAASGKSTLMRSIFEQPKLDEHLKVWAKDRSLQVYKFYFWNSGSILQKSQNGLFRSLLYEMFTQRPALVEATLPDVVSSTLDLPFEELSELRRGQEWRTWTLRELKKCFLAALEQTAKTTRYCFLIDGLDEFDGNYFELTSFLKEIANQTHVKFCLSSRPLLALEQELGAYPKLQLQDLTKGDIRAFAQDNLLNHARFRSLADEQTAVSAELINDIVEASSGVFLWVRLVVKSLLEGLSNHDELSDLQRRLRDLPAELEGLYTHMLNSISPQFYREQGSRLFQLVYQSSVALTAAELSFADDLDEELPLRTKMGSISSENLIRRTTNMIPRLKSRCAGLLEVPHNFRKTADPSQCTVQYLHLTVKEFLEQPAVWSSLLSLTRPQNFDATTSLLRATLMMLKCRTRFCEGRHYEDCSWDKTVRTQIRMATNLALRAEYSTGKSQTSLLLELDATASQLLAVASNSVGGIHWTAHMHSYDVGCPYCPRSFLVHTILNGLTSFVKAQLACPSIQSEDMTHTKQNLLEYIIWECPLATKASTASSAMVAMLLEAGFDPNEWTGGLTPWKQVLKYIERSSTWSDNRRLDSSWIDICQIEQARVIGHPNNPYYNPGWLVMTPLRLTCIVHHYLTAREVAIASPIANIHTVTVIPRGTSWTTDTTRKAREVKLVALAHHPIDQRMGLPEERTTTAAGNITPLATIGSEQGPRGVVVTRLPIRDPRIHSRAE